MEFFATLKKNKQTILWAWKWSAKGRKQDAKVIYLSLHCCGINKNNKRQRKKILITVVLTKSTDITSVNRVLLHQTIKCNVILGTYTHTDNSSCLPSVTSSVSMIIANLVRSEVGRQETVNIQ